LLTLLAAVWLTGCMQEEFDAIPPTAEKGVRFSLTVPDVGVPSVFAHNERSRSSQKGR